MTEIVLYLTSCLFRLHLETHNLIKLCNAAIYINAPWSLVMFRCFMVAILTSWTSCINHARELSSDSSHFYFPDCFPPISTWLFSTSSNSSPKPHFRVALQPLSSTYKLCPLLTRQSVFFCFHYLGHSSAHCNPAVYIQCLPSLPSPLYS